MFVAYGKLVEQGRGLLRLAIVYSGRPLSPMLVSIRAQPGEVRSCRRPTGIMQGRP